MSLAGLMDLGSSATHYDYILGHSAITDDMDSSAAVAAAATRTAGAGLMEGLVDTDQLGGASGGYRVAAAWRAITTSYPPASLPTSEPLQIPETSARGGVVRASLDMSPSHGNPFAHYLLTSPRAKRSSTTHAHEHSHLSDYCHTGSSSRMMSPLDPYSNNPLPLHLQAGSHLHRGDGPEGSVAAAAAATATAIGGLMEGLDGPLISYRSLDSPNRDYFTMSHGGAGPGGKPATRSGSPALPQLLGGGDSGDLCSMVRGGGPYGSTSPGLECSAAASVAATAAAATGLMDLQYLDDLDSIWAHAPSHSSRSSMVLARQQQQDVGAGAPGGSLWATIGATPEPFAAASSPPLPPVAPSSAAVAASRRSSGSFTSQQQQQQQAAPHSPPPAALPSPTVAPREDGPPGLPLPSASRPSVILPSALGTGGVIAVGAGLGTGLLSGLRAGIPASPTPPGSTHKLASRTASLSLPSTANWSSSTALSPPPLPASSLQPDASLSLSSAEASAGLISARTVRRSLSLSLLALCPTSGSAEAAAGLMMMEQLRGGGGSSADIAAASAVAASDGLVDHDTATAGLRLSKREREASVGKGGAGAMPSVSEHVSASPLDSNSNASATTSTTFAGAGAASAMGNPAAEWLATASASSLNAGATNATEAAALSTPPTAPPASTRTSATQPDPSPTRPGPATSATLTPREQQGGGPTLTPREQQGGGSDASSPFASATAMAGLVQASFPPAYPLSLLPEAAGSARQQGGGGRAWGSAPPPRRPSSSRTPLNPSAPWSRSRAWLWRSRPPPGPRA